MSQSSHNPSQQAEAQIRETRSSWLWLAVAALLVIGTVFGYLRASRAFWRVSGPANESALGPRV